MNQDASNGTQWVENGRDAENLASLERSLAGHQLAAAVDTLPVPHRQVMRWQLGLDGPAADATTIAARLALPVERIDELVAEALEDVGWSLVCNGFARIRDAA